MISYATRSWTPTTSSTMPRALLCRRYAETTSGQLWANAQYNPQTTWQGSAASPSHNNQFDIKIDHRFGDHDLFSAKYSEDQNGGDPLNCFGNVADPCDYGPGTGSAHLVAINHTHTF